MPGLVGYPVVKVPDSVEIAPAPFAYECLLNLAVFGGNGQDNQGNIGPFLDNIASRRVQIDILTVTVRVIDS